MPTESKHTVAVEIKSDAKDLLRENRRAGQSMNTMAVQAERASTKVGRAYTGMVTKIKAARRELQRGIMGRAGGMARGALGMAGIFGIGAMIQQTRDLEMRFSRFGAAAGGSISNMQKAMSRARKEVRAVSNEFGLSQDNVLGYAARVQELTGSSELALGTLKDMGKVALATGADMSSLGGVVTLLNTKLGISKNEFMSVMDVFSEQGDKGSFEMKNLADNFSQVLNLAGRFNASGIGGARQLGALMQMASRGSGGNAAEAETSATRLLEFVSGGGSKFKKYLGIDVRGPNGQMRQISDLLPAIAQRIVEMQDSGTMVQGASKGTRVPIVEKMKELFGARGFKTMSAFIAEARGGRQGDTALFSELVSAGGSGASLNRKAKFISETPATKLNKALTRINNSVQSKMLPMLSRLADKMGAMVPIVQMVMDHFIALAKVFAAFKIGGFLNRAFAGTSGGGHAVLAGQGPLAPGQKRASAFRTFAGRHGQLAGGALAIGGGLAGSITGTRTEQGLDLVAGTAALAGGPMGLAAGGTYLAGKILIKATTAEIFSEKVGHGKTKTRLDRLMEFADIAEGGARREARKSGAAGQSGFETLQALSTGGKLSDAKARLAAAESLAFKSPDQRARFDKLYKAEVADAKQRQSAISGPGGVIGSAIKQAGTKGAIGQLATGSFGGLDILGTGTGEDGLGGFLGELPTTTKEIILLRQSVEKLAAANARLEKRGIKVSTDTSKSPSARLDKTAVAAQ